MGIVEDNLTRVSQIQDEHKKLDAEEGQLIREIAQALQTYNYTIAYRNTNDVLTDVLEARTDGPGQDEQAWG